MSGSPSTSLPYGPLVRTLSLFVVAALFVSLAGRHKATREIMSVASVGGDIRNDETAKVRGGLHELVIDPAHPAVSQYKRGASSPWNARYTRRLCVFPEAACLISPTSRFLQIYNKKFFFSFSRL